MVIKIIDLAPNASSYADGEVVYLILLDELRKGSKIQVDFEGILTIPSAFVNAAFVRLLEEFDLDHIKKSINFIGTTKFINEMIKNRFEFVASSKN
jgi:hypothetical protein